MDGWFAFDDPWFLASARSIGFWEYVRRSFDVTDVGSLPEFDRYRPLWPIWFRLQYEVFGLHAAGYHVTAIGLHLAAAVLVRRLARSMGLSGGSANLAAAVFVLHPAYAEAVAWISGSNRVAATIPALGSLLAWIAWLERGSGTRLAVAVLLFFVSCLFHPSALALAPVYPALAWLRLGDSGRLTLAAVAAGWLPIALLAGALAGVHAWVRLERPVAAGFDLGWHIWANYGAFFGMAAAPVCPSSLGCYSPPLRTAAEAILLAGSAAFVVGAAATLRHWGVRSLPAVCLVWFAVALAPDATLVMGAFGRTMHLPGVPFALWIAAAADAPEVLQRKAGPALRWMVRPAAGTAAVGAIALLAVSTHFVLLVRDAGRENAEFIAALRRAYPELPAGTTVVVEGAPANLTAFDDTRLQALVDVYYEDVRAVSASRAVEPTGPAVRFSFER